jgi:hypothetical protein
VNFVDLEVLPSAAPLTPVLQVLVSPVVVEPPSPLVDSAPEPPRAVLDRSPSYWVRRRREQELVARALIDETSG